VKKRETWFDWDSFLKRVLPDLLDFTTCFPWSGKRLPITKTPKKWPRFGARTLKQGYPDLIGRQWDIWASVFPEEPGCEGARFILIKHNGSVTIKHEFCYHQKGCWNPWHQRFSHEAAHFSRPVACQENWQGLAYPRKGSRKDVWPQTWEAEEKLGGLNV